MYNVFSINRRKSFLWFQFEIPALITRDDARYERFVVSHLARNITIFFILSLEAAVAIRRNQDSK